MISDCGCCVDLYAQLALTTWRLMNRNGENPCNRVLYGLKTQSTCKALGLQWDSNRGPQSFFLKFEWEITSSSKTTFLQREPLLTMFYTVNRSPLLVTKLVFMLTNIVSKCQRCPVHSKCADALGLRTCLMIAFWVFVFSSPCTCRWRAWRL